jgi:anti-sigma factor RsiW
MTDPDAFEDRDALLAAAVAGALTPAEAQRFEALRAADPEVDREVAELRALAERLGAAGLIDPWVADAPSPDLRARVARIGVADVPPRRRRAWVVPATAAAFLSLGLVVGFVVPLAVNAPPSGPPGTLGAVEHVDLTVATPDVRIDADLVAHTWGTEAIIEATGLEPGETYAVTVVGRDGQEYSAGEMLGSTVEILCHLNAAVLREDVEGIRVSEPDGTVVASADVPHA